MKQAFGKSIQALESPRTRGSEQMLIELFSKKFKGKKGAGNVIFWLFFLLVVTAPIILEGTVNAQAPPNFDFAVLDPFVNPPRAEWIDADGDGVQDTDEWVYVYKQGDKVSLMVQIDPHDLTTNELREIDPDDIHSSGDIGATVKNLQVIGDISALLDPAKVNLTIDANSNGVPDNAEVQAIYAGSDGLDNDFDGAEQVIEDDEDTSPNGFNERYLFIISFIIDNRFRGASGIGPATTPPLPVRFMIKNSVGNIKNYSAWREELYNPSLMLWRTVSIAEWARDTGLSDGVKNPVYVEDVLYPNGHPVYGSSISYTPTPSRVGVPTWNDGYLILNNWNRPWRIQIDTAAPSVSIFNQVKLQVQSSGQVNGPVLPADVVPGSGMNILGQGNFIYEIGGDGLVTLEASFPSDSDVSYVEFMYSETDAPGSFKPMKGIFAGDAGIPGIYDLIGNVTDPGVPGAAAGLWHDGINGDDDADGAADMMDIEVHNAQSVPQADAIDNDADGLVDAQDVDESGHNTEIYAPERDEDEDGIMDEDEYVVRVAGGIARWTFDPVRIARVLKIVPTKAYAIKAFAYDLAGNVLEQAAAPVYVVFRVTGKGVQEVAGTARAVLYRYDQVVTQKFILENRTYDLAATVTGTVNYVTFQYSMDTNVWRMIPTAGGEPNPDPGAPFKISWRPMLARLSADLWVDYNQNGVKDQNEPAYQPGDDLYIRAVAGAFGPLGRYSAVSGLVLDPQRFIPYYPPILPPVPLADAEPDIAMAQTASAAPVMVIVQVGTDTDLSDGALIPMAKDVILKAMSSDLDISKAVFQYARVYPDGTFADWQDIPGTVDLTILTDGNAMAVSKCDTTSWTPGRYDLRCVATDNDGWIDPQLAPVVHVSVGRGKYTAFVVNPAAGAEIYGSSCNMVARVYHDWDTNDDGIISVAEKDAVDGEIRNVIFQYQKVGGAWNTAATDVTVDVVNPSYAEWQDILALYDLKGTYNIRALVEDDKGYVNDGIEVAIIITGIAQTRTRISNFASDSTNNPRVSMRIARDGIAPDIGVEVFKDIAVEAIRIKLKAEQLAGTLEPENVRFEYKISGPGVDPSSDQGWIIIGTDSDPEWEINWDIGMAHILHNLRAATLVYVRARAQAKTGGIWDSYVDGDNYVPFVSMVFEESAEPMSTIAQIDRDGVSLGNISTEKRVTGGILTFRPNVTDNYASGFSLAGSLPDMTVAVMDATAPVMVMTQVGNDTDLSNGAVISIAPDVQLAAQTASSDVNRAVFQCAGIYPDGARAEWQDIPGAVDLSIINGMAVATWNTTSFTPGSYALRCMGIDNTGNMDPQRSPIVHVVLSADVNTAGIAQVDLFYKLCKHNSRDGDILYWHLAGADFEPPFAINWDIGNIPSGKYDLLIVATDHAGNRSADVWNSISSLRSVPGLIRTLTIDTINAGPMAYVEDPDLLSHNGVLQADRKILTSLTSYDGGVKEIWLDYSEQGMGNWKEIDRDASFSVPAFNIAAVRNDFTGYYYYDQNNNTRYDAGEPVWKDKPGGSTGRYNYHNRTVKEDILMGGFRPADEAWGRRFEDIPSSALDNTCVIGIARWADVNGDNELNQEDFIWIDIDNDKQYDCLADGVGEPIVYASQFVVWNSLPADNTYDIMVKASDKNDSAGRLGHWGVVSIGTITVVSEGVMTEPGQIRTKISNFESDQTRNPRVSMQIARYGTSPYIKLQVFRDVAVETMRIELKAAELAGTELPDKVTFQYKINNPANPTNPKDDTGWKDIGSDTSAPWETNWDIDPAHELHNLTVATLVYVRARAEKGAVKDAYISESNYVPFVGMVFEETIEPICTIERIERDGVGIGDLSSEKRVTGGILNIIPSVADNHSSNIARVEFYYKLCNKDSRDGDTLFWTLAGVDTEPPFMITWDVSNISTGKYELIAVAKDQAGNASANVWNTVENLRNAGLIRTLTIDHTGPTAYLEDPDSMSHNDRLPEDRKMLVAVSSYVGCIGRIEPWNNAAEQPVYRCGEIGGVVRCGPYQDLNGNGKWDPGEPWFLPGEFTPGDGWYEIGEKDFSIPSFPVSRVSTNFYGYYYYDWNGNERFDVGEVIWKDLLGGNSGKYDYNDSTVKEPVMMGEVRPADGSIGSKFGDIPGKVTDYTCVQGVASWADVNGNSELDQLDFIWIDLDNDKQYDCLADGVGEPVIYASNFIQWGAIMNLPPTNNIQFLVSVRAANRDDSAGKPGNWGNESIKPVIVENIVAAVWKVNSRQVYNSYDPVTGGGGDFMGTFQRTTGNVVNIVVRVWPEPRAGATVQLWFRYDDDLYPGGPDSDYDGYPDNDSITNSRWDGIDNDWDGVVDEEQRDKNDNDMKFGEVNTWRLAITTGGTVVTAENPGGAEDGPDRNWFEVTLAWDVSSLKGEFQYQFLPVVVDGQGYGPRLNYTNLPFIRSDAKFPQSFIYFAYQARPKGYRIIIDHQGPYTYTQVAKDSDEYLWNEQSLDFFQPLTDGSPDDMIIRTNDGPPGNPNSKRRGSEDYTDDPGENNYQTYDIQAKVVSIIGGLDYTTTFADQVGGVTFQYRAAGSQWMTLGYDRDPDYMSTFEFNPATQIMVPVNIERGLPNNYSYIGNMIPYSGQLVSGPVGNLVPGILSAYTQRIVVTTWSIDNVDIANSNYFPPTNGTEYEFRVIAADLPDVYGNPKNITDMDVTTLFDEYVVENRVGDDKAHAISDQNFMRDINWKKGVPFEAMPSGKATTENIFNNPHKDVANLEYITGPRDPGSDRKDGNYWVNNLVPKAEINRVDNITFNWTTQAGVNPAALAAHIDAYVNGSEQIPVEAIVNPDPDGKVDGKWGKTAEVAGDILEVRFYSRPHPPEADTNPNYYRNWPSGGAVVANGWMLLGTDKLAVVSSGDDGYTILLDTGKLIADLSLYPAEKVPADTRDFELMAMAKDGQDNEEPFLAGIGEITVRIGPAILSAPIVTDDGHYTNSTSQIHAVWTPGTNIVEYQCAIGTTPGETDTANWTSVGTNTEFTFTGLNLVYEQTYYFSVKAKNNEGQWSDVGVSDGITVVQVPMSQIGLSLNPGWNLISISLDTGETDLLTVLKPIEGTYNEVWTYDAGPGTWKKYIPDSPLNNLSTIEYGKGYWIKMADSVVLRLTGKQITNTAIQLSRGWNLAGYNATQSRPVGVAMASIAGKYSGICAYDNLTECWLRYYAGTPVFLNNLSQLEPNAGYWIYAKEDCVWILAP